MSKYDAAFAPRDPSELARDGARAATASVQSSLYGRLRREFGSSKAGVIAWMMLHAADGAHRDHDEACAALDGRTNRELSELVAAAEGALRAAKADGTREVAGRVREAMGAAIDRARGRMGLEKIERL